MAAKKKVVSKQAPAKMARKKAPAAAATRSAKVAAPAKAKPVAARSRAKSSWFDESTSVPVIAEKAQQLKGFLAAAADGVIEKKELKAQEERLVAVMREVEPLLDAALHDKVTQLLCEMSAYDLMQVMHAFHKSRPKTEFRG